MDRVSSTGYQTIGGIRTWQNANEGAGIQGTTFDQIFFAGVQESIVDAIAKSGQTPTDSTLGAADYQLTNAILAFAGANVQAVNSTPGSALPAISSGLVVVNATSGNISITLPASAALGGTVQRWKFVRTDATGNAVSVAFHSGDTLLVGGGAGPLQLAPQGQIDLTGDGTTHWVLPGTQGSSGNGHCRLVLNSASLMSLVPYGGNNIQIAGGLYQLPSGGVTLANTGLTANTLYYAYASQSAGVVALSLSTTGHATDTTAGNVGVEIMSGNNAYSFVGWIYPNAGTPGTFNDTPTWRGCVNWFNRRNLYLAGALTNAIPETSTAPVDFGSAYHVIFIAIGDEAVSLEAGGMAQNNTLSNSCSISVGVDGVAESPIAGLMYSAAANQNSGLYSSFNGLLGEGAHVASLMGAVSSGTGGFTVGLSGMIRG